MIRFVGRKGGLGAGVLASKPGEAKRSEVVVGKAVVNAVAVAAAAAGSVISIVNRFNPQQY